MNDIIRQNFIEAREKLDEFMSDHDSMAAVERAARMLVNAFQAGNKAISCGNGGSMCDAMHFAEELTGRFRDDRQPLPAVSISDPTHMSCVGNDYGFDEIFSRYVLAMGKSGDILLAISTSGNSANVIKAAEAAKSKGMKIIGLTGKSGGKLASLCDVEIRAPQSPYADRAQEIHIKVIHSMIQCVESTLS